MVDQNDGGFGLVKTTIFEVVLHREFPLMARPEVRLPEGMIISACEPGRSYSSRRSRPPRPSPTSGPVDGAVELTHRRTPVIGIFMFGVGVMDNQAEARSSPDVSLEAFRPQVEVVAT